MGESPKRSKVPSYGCNFRHLLGGRSRRRGSKQDRSRGSVYMGQSKSNAALSKVPQTPVLGVLTTTSGTTNRIEENTMVELAPRDKTLKSRSISSLSKALRVRKWRPKRRGSISASFNMNDRAFKVEFMNVNRATEEELMTLPGVNRALARNIVIHRTLIGGYRKVDDLALVSGMGATKLDLIRSEICTSKRRDLSGASSKSPSIESLPSSSGSSRVYRSPKLINLNTATIFELMGVNGINQALAARIINYRDKKGPFRSIDDLRHIGMSYRRLGALRIYLTLESIDGHIDNKDNKSIQSHDDAATPIRTAIVQNHNANNLIEGHRRVSSNSPMRKDDIGLEDEDNDVSSLKTPSSSFPVDSMAEIFELMSLKSHRPTTDCSFGHKVNNRSTYRVASWNMENFTQEKVSNPGVLEVLTRTILENGLSLVAVQEICDKSALQKICDELNEPRLSRNRAWRKPRGSWSFVLDENPMHFNKPLQQMGILYNAHKINGVTIPKSMEPFSPIQNGNLWQFSVFNVKVKTCSWVIINVLSTPLSNYTNGHAVDAHRSSVSDWIQLVVEETEADGGLVLGSFNSQNVEKGLGKLEALENISPATNEDSRNGLTGSFWITNGMKAFATGESGRIVEGLTHLAIPNGWSWGGRVTTSSPFWCSFYEDKAEVTVV